MNTTMSSKVLGQLCVSVILIACGADGSNGGGTSAASGPGDPMSRAGVLESLHANVFEPTFEAFSTKSLALLHASEAWKNSPNEQTFSDVKDAWRATMRVWQRAELMQIGPAGAQGRRVAGADLRDKIYSFPLTNTCRVDQELVRGSFSESDWAENAAFNVRGLDALEYLIFGVTTANTCPSVSEINQSGSWEALRANEGVFESKRTEYAHVLATDLVTNAAALRDAWRKSETTFATGFTTGQEPFATQKDALDQVFAALFYADQVVKDLKLAKPSGLSDDCLTETCPESVESRWSKTSKVNLYENVSAIRLIFNGGPDTDDLGFDDLLVSEGAPELAQTILENIDEALLAVDRIQDSVEYQLSTDPELIRGTHSAIRDITDAFKTQFVTVLNLSVPQEGAGDND